MLQIQHLTITHVRDLRTILQDFSVTLNKGDKAVIIGEEGNGKSTLLKWVADPALVESYADAEGICVHRGERLAYLPQQLPEEDATRTVYEFFAGEPLFSDASPRRLAKLAASLGLPSEFFCWMNPPTTSTSVRWSTWSGSSGSFPASSCSSPTTRP